ncbi:Spo0E like sporulation regulatory protein [Oceanobacillus limi]|uniref:Spo0E like sporulation regulatory protein n=1 Tax=Oceanobacillus limi TaxID=930131 RepID=A0A1I0BM73_9BACI|nr:Spo0E like sporulation regulatory protein [Oceanobacillus limi]
MQKKLLLEQIRQKRENMLKTAAYSGFNSQQTLERSQELDRLIIKYQRLNKDNY